jgi:hypothetical protein
MFIFKKKKGNLKDSLFFFLIVSYERKVFML